MVPLIFFLNGELHRRQQIVKSQNWLVAWNYPREERMQYNLSFVLREFQYAFKTKEIGKLLRFSLYNIQTYMDRRMVCKPSGRAYSLKTQRPGLEYWSEDDLIKLRQELYDLHPKRNGYAKSLNLVSHAELMSTLRGDESYYIKDKSGNLIKVWKAL